MPQFIVFMINNIRGAAEAAGKIPKKNDPKPQENTADEKKEGEEKEKEGKQDPFVEHMMRDMVEWTTSEAKKLKGEGVLLDASAATSVRVDFHDPPDDVKARVGKGEDVDFDDSGLPASSLTYPHDDDGDGHNDFFSARVQGYYVAEFPSLDACVAWARRCPMPFDGFHLEIRQLRDAEALVREMPAWAGEAAGDRVLEHRREAREQGRLRVDGDGTMWVRVEKEKWLEEKVGEAEKRKAEA
ncbi:hypothetical protein GGR56DRAFT_658524 [Xylariaceae sp. FL0804]|nr:hypothetical protein GGR56DRAFT_658524 [Xylariaceae sp. FL0804]